MFFPHIDNYHDALPASQISKKSGRSTRRMAGSAKQWLGMSVIMLTFACLAALAACVPIQPVAAPAGNTGGAAAASSSGNKIPQLLEKQEKFKFNRLLEALKNVKLDDNTTLYDKLSEKGPFTLFAPTDDAFAKLEQASGSLPKDPAELTRLLQYHIINDNGVDSQTLIRNRNIVTSNPLHPVTVIQDDIGIRVNNAIMQDKDLKADNGFVHVIDTVLTDVAPEPNPQLSDLDTAIETWEPYQMSGFLPINDAELVPGHPVMHNAVRSLSEPLQKFGAHINIARTVRLYHEGQVTYIAPRGSDMDKDLDKLGKGEPFVIAVVALTSKPDQEKPEQAYVVRLYDFGIADKDTRKSAIELVDKDFKTGPRVDGETLQGIVEATGLLPVAGLFYGSTWYKSEYYDRNGNYHCTCYKCIFTTCQYATKAACQAACKH